MRAANGELRGDRPIGLYAPSEKLDTIAHDVLPYAAVPEVREFLGMRAARV
jgi:hypothetical protein